MVDGCDGENRAPEPNEPEKPLEGKLIVRAL
jgi:hypothetical protein